MLYRINSLVLIVYISLICHHAQKFLMASNTFKAGTMDVNKARFIL